MMHPSIGRRPFIAGTAALGASAATTPAALAQVPKRGGHLIVGVASASTTDSFDPTRWIASYPFFVGNQVYDQLTRVDRQGKIRPALAESWDTKPGAKEWMFRVRRGVHFHNGKELTAQDVVYSINHHRGKDSQSAARSMVEGIDDIKAASKYDVAVTLAAGNVDLPAVLGEFHLVITYDQADFKNGIGTGAFVLESFEPGVRTQTKRNTNDWRSDRGWVDSVETLGINDPNARLAALVSGSVHLIAKVEATSVAAVLGNPNLQLFRVAGGQHDVFAMFTDTAPYSNNDLRLALKYGIDRQAMLNQLLRGYGKLGNDHPIPSWDPFYASDIPQRAYDPDKARFYLKKSGYNGQIQLTVADTAFNGAVEGAQLFQAAAAKAGLNIDINRVPNNGYWSNVWLHQPFCASIWGGNPTADLMLTSVYAGSSGENETHWRVPKFDQLLVAARAEQNLSKRRQMYHDLQFMLHEEGGAIIPVFTDFLDAASKKIAGFVSIAVGDMSGNRAAEEVWFV